MKLPAPLLSSNSLLHIPLGIVLYASAGLATTATITDLAAYQTQRPCVHDCYEMSPAFDGPANVANEMECEIEPVVRNECFCRPDMQNDAVSFIRSCVSSKCEKDYDVTQAVSLYTDYCTSAGYTVEATTTSSDSESESTATTDPSPSETTSSDSSTTMNTADDPTDTTTDTPPASTSDDRTITVNSGDDGSLNAGEIVGIVVGILGFLATTGTIFFQYKNYQRKKAKAEAAAGVPH